MHQLSELDRRVKRREDCCCPHFIKAICGKPLKTRSSPERMWMPPSPHPSMQARATVVDVLVQLSTHYIGPGFRV